MKSENIYNIIFRTYIGLMDDAGDDGVQVMNIYQRAYNAMLIKGEYGSQLHSKMNMWVITKTLKKLRSLPKSIKEYGVARGDWNGNVAKVLYAQYNNMKNEIIPSEYGYSRTTAQKYAMMVMNVESVSVKLFGWDVLFNDCPFLHSNKDDVKCIKELLNE